MNITEHLERIIEGGHVPELFTSLITNYGPRKAVDLLKTIPEPDLEEIIAYAVELIKESE